MMNNNALILADAAIRSLADDADLSDSLLTIFARILSHQVTVNTETEEVEYGAAFDKLLSVFTFVAIRQDERQGSPSDFGGGGEDNPKGHALLAFQNRRIGVIDDVLTDTRSRHEMPLLRDDDHRSDALTRERRTV
ncbi:hypothetical protein [Halochromatium salexigens]|uniref:Uncharacterized protein n=1 Tax=Halochromatium salexigens TaxID=49447 RepID=A0AAJ0UGC6_HALSE|nr:hypothetical protein [Halochromatium salexigens]MBK5930964.1 hypothetical protein [Halochromatium salexigens]